jgi:hypothetical protein
LSPYGSLVGLVAEIATKGEKPRTIERDRDG